MRVYIMTDQEGVAGVVNVADYGGPEGRYYETARELTTLEVNAAIEGAIEGGGTEFLVVDGHGQGAINPSLLHPRAHLLTGRPGGYPFACDGSFDFAFSVGQHAKANTDGGHLCHTGSFATEDLRINGKSVGEMGCNFLFAAYFGVRTIFLSGDRAACDEARELVPGIETVSVKEGLKRGSAAGLTAEENAKFNGAAIHLQPEAARELVRAGARRAMERAAEMMTFWLEPPYELVEERRPETPGAPAKIAVNRNDDLLELLRMGRRFDVKGG